MTLRTATVEDLLSWKPYLRWSREKIREVAGESHRFTALDVLHHPHITPEDKLWVVLRPALISKQDNARFVEICIAHVLDTYDPQHPKAHRTRRLIDSARKYCAEGLGHKGFHDAWFVTRALRWSIWGHTPPDEDRAEAWRAEGNWQVEHLCRMLEE